MPYEIKANYGPEFMDTWKKATDEFLKHTGIEWVKKGPNHCNYVHVLDNGKDMCVSTVGMAAPAQSLWLCELLVLLLYIKVFSTPSTYRIAD